MPVLWLLSVEPSRPLECFTDSIGRRPGQDGYGEKSCANNFHGKIAKANGPAIGFRASAAWLEADIGRPGRVESGGCCHMNARATRLENAIPM